MTQQYYYRSPTPRLRRVQRARRPLHRAYLSLTILLATVLTVMVIVGATEAASSIFKFQLAWFQSDGKTGEVTEKLTQDSPLQPPNKSDLSKYERTVAKLLNQARAERGLGALAFNKQIADVAREHSSRMSQNGFFGAIDPDKNGPSDRLAHTGLDRLETVLETVGSGYQTPERLVKALLDKKRTAEIVLNPDVNQVGVGYAFNQKDPRGAYYHYWTVDLVQRAGLNFTVEINDGDAETSSRQVQLTLNAGAWAKEMMLANSSDFTSAKSLPYSDKVSWTLSEKFGVKTIYIRLKNAAGETFDTSATIKLVPAPVVVDPNANPPNTVKKSVTNLRLTTHGPADLFHISRPARTTAALSAPAGSALAANVGPDYYTTSGFMAGKVAVGVVFPQCNGAIDRCTEHWDQARMDTVFQKVQQAMNWWNARTNGAVTFVYDQQRAIPTSYEPISHPQSDESLWLTEVMANAGFPAASGEGWPDQVLKYDNWLRQTKHTDWAFTVFVVDSLNDADGSFANGYFAYAYGGGPDAVMTYDNANYGIDGMPAVFAHETGHIFGALDEYTGANVPCTQTAGYLIVQNQNSELPGCAINVESIMRGGGAPYIDNAVDTYALGQVGFRDLNGNGRPDPIDTKPKVVLDTVPTAAVARVTITGTAQDQPNMPPSTYPQPGPPPITINNITSVQYRVDGGAWQNASASDGAFDTTTESFTFSPSLADGQHTIEVKAVNRVSNASSLVSTTVTIIGSGIGSTATPTNSPTRVPTTVTPTNSPTRVPASATPTDSPTRIAATATATLTSAPSSTPNSTPTRIAPTATPTIQTSPTATAFTPAASPTNTRSSTPVPPTATATQTFSVTATDVPTGTPACTGSSEGTVYLDRDGNGNFDAGEPTIDGATLTLKQYDGSRFATVAMQLSGADGTHGHYRFASLTPGNYQISETPAQGYAASSNSLHAWAISIGCSTTTIDFGDQQMAPTSTPVATQTSQPTPTPTRGRGKKINAGWSLLAAPANSSYTASSLAAEINAQGGSATEIDRWNNGSWEAFIVGYPFNDFSLDPKVGVFVRAASASDWTPSQGSSAAQRSPAETRDVNTGWNLLAGPACGDGESSCYTASSLVASINAQGGSAVEVDAWVNGTWTAFVAGYPFNDFAVNAGDAYFVRANSSSTWSP